MLHEYIVTIRNIDMPNERPTEVCFHAESTVDAKKQARKYMRNHIGHTKQDGKLAYRSVRVDSAPFQTVTGFGSL